MICFYRYFDPETGRLMVSETDEGMRIREEGEIIVGGIHFAKEIHSSKMNKGAAAEEAKIEFEKITINESFSPSLFTVPMPKQNQ